MSIGKYITNAGVLTSLLGGLGVAKQTKKMPNDWRRYVVWLVWVASVVLAFASVSKAEEDHAFIADAKEREKRRKKQEKAVKKAHKRADSVS